MTRVVDSIPTRIVLAPLAGGPSTPELAAAVSEAGGFGFLAAGYLGVDDLAGRLTATRRLTDRPFGVNLFVPGSPASPEAVARYRQVLAAEADRVGVELGPARRDDDGWAAKLDLLVAQPVPVVSFTFGCPEPAVLARLRAVGSETWVTVTTPDEADQAAAAGADALVVQGAEAGGHRGGFTDDPTGPEPIALLPLLQLVAARTTLPLVAAGGIATGRGIAAVLSAGASAAALGTAFLRCPEAGTAGVYRAALAGGAQGSSAALASGAQTALTRAFTGRLARGIVNRFLTEHSSHAPSGYPEIHHLTSPLRRYGREAGIPDLVNLWAGQAYPLGVERPAAELVADLHAETRDALLAVTAARPGASS